jgi:pyruvate,water dikinase
MELFRRFWRRLFPEKPAHSAKEIEALRLDFKKRYFHFQQLIRANNRVLSAMADMEQALQGERPFGMAFVRSSCITVSVKVYQMIRKIQLLSPDKYKELFNRFDYIQEQIGPILNICNEPQDLRTIIPLVDIDKDMINLVGSKMANLGEIRNNIRLRVPGGFVITANAYHRFIEHNDLRASINNLMQAAMDSNIETLYRLNDRLNQMIVEAEVPHDLETAMMTAWRQLEADAGDKITAAVRSSAVGEDEKGSSFAGMHLSMLNVSGDHILQSYKEIIASKYSLPAINYRQLKGFRDEDIAMCVGCMEMVNAIAGGVIYTRNPIDISDDSIFISAGWGLPKAVVDGTVNCDLFVVSRQQPMKIIREKIGDKKNKFVCYTKEGVCRVDLTGDSRNLPSLSTEQVMTLAILAVKMEKHYGGPQDIEWAVDHNGHIYTLQCRPLQQSETDPVMAIANSATGTTSAEIISSEGITASPGTASGSVFRVDSDLDGLRFPADAVLLTHSALPRWASLLNRAAAVITEHGSFASHLANVAREFKVPALFGVPDILTSLNTGDLITVDTWARKIFHGRIEALLKKKSEPKGLMEKGPVFQTLKEVSRHIIPLTLIDPDAPEFKPANCQTLQDITRFIHEKSVQEMFSFGKDHTFSERAGKQLYYHVPMKWWILNLDDGFKEEVKEKYVKIENIASIPMLAYWEGFTAIPWEGPPAIDGKGLMSIMFRSTSNPSLVVGRRSTYMDQNYFMISKNFCSLNSRLGYHFSILEAYVADRPTENYIKFQFKGGAADYNRRLQRVLFIKRLLEEYEFRVEITEDNLVSRIDGREPGFMVEHLIILGYLSIHTRQIDMIMTNPDVVKHYRAKYKKEIDFLINTHKRKFL